MAIKIFDRRRRGTQSVYGAVDPRHIDGSACPPKYKERKHEN
jgi:hypothetical protein